MVETALCLTFVLLPLSAGIVQFGSIISTEHQLDQIAREGGRYAAVHGGEKIFDSDETVSGSFANYMKSVVDGKTAVLWSDVKPNMTVTPTFSNRLSGQAITVSIAYNIKKKYFLQNFPGMNSISPTYNARSTFVLE